MRTPPPATGPPDESGEPACPDVTLDGLRERWHVAGDELADRYALGEVLGRGGMGVVWLGHDARLRRDVAVKVSPLGEEPAQLARFLHEAQITGQLTHPNIPPIFDLGLGPEGTGWFSMRALPGRTLSQVLREGVLPVPRALELFGKVCDAVAYAHSRGVLHRDLKPGNVIVGDFGEVYVIDWGLARRLSLAVETDVEDPRVLDPQGLVSGTPGFMSPEQAADATLDVRSDVYSLGALLYTMLTGRTPFGLGPDVLQRVHRGEYDPPRKVRPDLPWELAAVVRRAMALRPEDRYPGVAALQADLAAWRDGRPLPGVRYTLARRVASSIGRNRRGLLLGFLAGGLAGTLGLVALAGYAFTLEQARDRAVQAEREAEGRALAQQVALARFRASTGSPSRARQELLDVRSRARTLGVDDRVGVLALSALDEAYPPPEIRVPGGGRSVLDPGSERIGIAVGRRIFVHDLLTGALLHSWEAPGDPILDRFHDGRLDVLVRDDRRVDSTDALTGVVRWSATLASNADDRFVVSDDGHHMAWSSGDRSTIFADGQPVAELERVVVALSRDGRRALVYERKGEHRQVERHDVIDVATGAVLGGWPVGSDFVVTPDLDRVVVTSAQGVQVLAADGSVVWSGGPAVPTLALADQLLAELGTDGVIELRDLATGAVRLRRSAGEGRSGMDGSPRLGKGWIAAEVGGELRLWSRSERRPVVQAHTGATLALDVSPDGELVATSGWEGDVALWDRKSGAQLGRWRVCDQGVRDVSFAPDGARLATADRAGRVRMIDLASGEIGPSLEAGRGIAMGARWHGEHIAAIYEDGHLVEWVDGAVASELHGSLRTTWGLALAGDRVVIGGRETTDAAGELWDLAAGQRLATTTTIDAGYGAALTADGSRWAVGRWGGSVLLVDARGEHVLQPPVDGPVMSLAFSPDGSLLAAGLFDGQVSVFDTTSLTEVLSAPLLPAAIQDLAFVPGTDVLLAGGGEPGAWTTLDLGRTERVGAVVMTLIPGVSPAEDHGAERAELAWDWAHLAQVGTGLPLARARLALGDRTGARDALAQAEGTVGTLAAWRRALSK